MSTYNSFVAMGFEPEDAVVYAIRSDLAIAISQLLEFKKLRQANAASLLGLPQSVISHIKRGKIEHLTIERLIRAMVRAGIPGRAEWPSAETACGGILSTSNTVNVVTKECGLHFAESPVFGTFETVSSAAESLPERAIGAS